MSQMFSIEDANEIAASSGGKFLNAKFLKSIPQMATKVRIIGGGSHMVPSFEDKTKLKKEVFIDVVSTIGTFDEPKVMPLNATNLNILMDGLGKQPASWIGKEIGVFYDPTVKVGGEVKGGIRVKVFEADPFTKLAAAPAPATVAASAPVADDIPF